MSDKVPPAEPQNLDKPGYLGESPPPGQLPPKGDRHWIDRPEQLLRAIDMLLQSNVIAIDAEFAQLRSRLQGDALNSSQRLALLQLAIDGHCFVVDALRLHDLSPLDAVVDNPHIVILLHGAGADLRVMAERGLNVSHYYDLEATSRAIFGQHESSLAAMLLRAFNVRLDKSLQRTDWTRRPLPPAMVAYAARDAEMTLALYHWLDQHYAWALKLYQGTTQQEPVAAWIEPFLGGSSPIPPDVALAGAIKQGIILDEEHIYADFRTALASLTHPMRRSRLLRLIADLSLVQLAPDIEPLLYARTADERAAAIRALGRLKVEQSKELIRPLLQDPVQDVRKAAQLALRDPSIKEPRSSIAPPARLADGARSWTIGDTPGSDDDNDWKARLRSIMDK